MPIPTKGNWGLIPAGGPLGDMVHEVTAPLLGPTQFGQHKPTFKMLYPCPGEEDGEGEEV